MLFAGLTTPFNETLPDANHELKTAAVMVVLQSLLASEGNVSCVNVIWQPIAIINAIVRITKSFFEDLSFFMISFFNWPAFLS